MLLSSLFAFSLLLFPFLLLRSLSSFSSGSALPRRRSLDLFSSLSSSKGLPSSAYHAFLCFHYLVFVFCIFWLEGHPLSQLSLMLFTTLLLFSLLASQKPFLSRVDNLLTQVNAFFLVLLYLWGIFLLFISLSSHRSNLGLSLIFGVLSINLFNIIVILSAKLSHCCNRKKRKKVKN